MKQDRKRVSKEKHELDYAKKLARDVLYHLRLGIKKKAELTFRGLALRQLKRVCEALLKVK